MQPSSLAVKKMLFTATCDNEEEATSSASGSESSGKELDDTGNWKPTKRYQTLPHEWYLMDPLQVEYEMQQIKPLEIPKGFMQQDDKIPSLGDFINPGDVKLCCATTISNPSEIYLAFAEHFPKKVDQYIWAMSDKYLAMGRGFHRSRWIARAKTLKPGMFVGVFSRDSMEWLRGRVIKQTTFNSVKSFEIQHIDLGESKKYLEGDIVYLKDEFGTTPSWTIKCRFALNDYYVQFQSGISPWPERTSDKMLKLLFDKRFYVKFIRRVAQNESFDDIWEVSIENFAQPHPILRGKQPLQEQIVSHIVEGQYME